MCVSVCDSLGRKAEYSNLWEVRTSPENSISSGRLKCKPFMSCQENFILKLVESSSGQKKRTNRLWLCFSFRRDTQMTINILVTDYHYTLRTVNKQRNRETRRREIEKQQKNKNAFFSFTKNHKCCTFVIAKGAWWENSWQESM